MTNHSETKSLTLKDEGNQAFKISDWDTAIIKYTEGIKLANDDIERQTLYKNRAAAFLKREDYEKVITDCTAALDISSNDPKALYRRGVAYNAQNNCEKAYKDLRTAQKIDPKNKDILNLLQTLHTVVQAKLEASTQLQGKANRLFELLLDVTSEKEMRETAANNLVALAKEKSGADLLVEGNLYAKLSQILKTERNSEVKLGCTRAVSEVCKYMNHTKSLLTELGLPWLLNLMNSSEVPQVNAGQYTFQILISTLSGSDLKNKECNKTLIEENKKEIDTIMYVLSSSITNRTMTPICRDAVIELICKNVGYKFLDWAEKFIKVDGLNKLLDVASEVPEYKYESSIDTTDSTKMIISVCLLKLYEAHYDDKMKTKFTDLIDNYIKEKLLSPGVESKVRVGVILTTLLYGPLDVGNTFMGREGILEMFLIMAQSGESVQQRIACETLIAAASKKDKCQAILAKGIDILKELYQSKDESVKVRALVGLCKLGSLGGSDASLKPFADGASLKLAEACRRFLLNANKDNDMRRWACEGLSYLTLDAEVKEKLIEDTQALRSIIELAKHGHQNCLYGIITTLVNLCNAYDKQDIIPEMVELAKFAKQHIPEEHEMDDKDFVDKRVNTLAEEGVASALVSLSKTESHNVKELIGRIFNAICENQHNRGKVVAEGGTKALLSLSADGTEKGMKCAAQALARIGITMDPEVAFPGQRAYEVVRPLLKLLAVDGTGLENFEGLMALCNIAGISESARQRIIKEGGLPQIEHYTFEAHELIRRAAIQCAANMCASPDMITILTGKNDRLKYLFLCCSDEDEEIVKAAGGAMCMALSSCEKLADKIFEAQDWEDILKFLISHPKPEIQYRGLVIISCVVHRSKEFAERVIDTHCKDALNAISQIDNPEFVLPKSRECAQEIINHCCKLGLIELE